MSTGSSQRRRGLIAATSALFVAAGIAVVSVAGAAQDAVVYVSDTSGFCFTTTPNKPACDAGERVDLEVETGDKVTWDFTGTNYHNAHPLAEDASTHPMPPGTPAIPTSGRAAPTRGRSASPASTASYCEVHPTMVGTVTVNGQPVETPTPTRDGDRDRDGDGDRPPRGPTATATPDAHTTTPAPGHASTAKDTTAPRLQRLSVKRVAAGARVRFWLSEPATVSIALARKGSKSSVAATLVQAPAGTRSLVLRTKRLKRGTYRVKLAPVDAMGNKGPAAAKSLRVK